MNPFSSSNVENRNFRHLATLIPHNNIHYKLKLHLIFVGRKSLVVSFFDHIQQTQWYLPREKQVRIFSCI